MKIKLIVLLFLAQLALTGCEKVINKAAAEYLKLNLKDTCGEDDPECIAAVEDQFDPCHEQYEDDWSQYMEASDSESDERLEIYSENMYNCIVDKDGDPYFYYSPE